MAAESDSRKTLTSPSDGGFSERVQRGSCTPPQGGSDSAKLLEAIKHLKMAHFLLAPIHALDGHISQPNAEEIVMARTEIEKALGYLQAPPE